MTAPLEIHAGEQFEKWIVLTIIPATIYVRKHAVCQCRCGIIGKVTPYDLLHGKSRGCLRCRPSSTFKNGHKLGGKSSTTRGSWEAMMQRCYNPKNIGWENYGGKGIAVCERWYSFDNFLADMGTKPSKAYSIERRKNDQGYTSVNCYWLLRSLQNRNRSNCHILTIHGESAPLVEWAERYNVPSGRVSARLMLGWDALAALTLPLHTRYASFIDRG